MTIWPFFLWHIFDIEKPLSNNLDYNLPINISFGVISVVIRSYFWFCTRWLLPVLLGEPYMFNPDLIHAKHLLQPVLFSDLFSIFYVIMKKKICTWAVPCSSHGFLLELCLGITSGGAQGILWNASIEPEIVKNPTCFTVALAPFL